MHPIDRINAILELDEKILQYYADIINSVIGDQKKKAVEIALDNAIKSIYGDGDQSQLEHLKKEVKKILDQHYNIDDFWKLIDKRNSLNKPFTTEELQDDITRLRQELLSSCDPKSMKYLINPLLGFATNPNRNYFRDLVAQTISYTINRSCEYTDQLIESIITLRATPTDNPISELVITQNPKI